MEVQSPIGEVDTRFSSEGAEPTPWYMARELLETAQIYWLTTVRRDGRPHPRRQRYELCAHGHDRDQQ